MKFRRREVVSISIERERWQLCFPKSYQIFIDSKRPLLQGMISKERGKGSCVRKKVLTYNERLGKEKGKIIKTREKASEVRGKQAFHRSIFYSLSSKKKSGTLQLDSVQRSVWLLEVPWFFPPFLSVPSILHLINNHHHPHHPSPFPFRSPLSFHSVTALKLTKTLKGVVGLPLSFESEV